MNPPQRPIVSVVIPTRNRAELLRQALASVYAQEGAGDEFDLDVVVVDDASSDDTSEVVRAYPQARCIRLGEKRGAAAARNVAIKASSGAYVAFLDDDDVWLPQRLRLHMPILKASPEIGAVYGQQITRKEHELDVVWPDPRRAPSGHVFEDFLLEEFISINTLLVRRSSMEKSGYFDESRRNLEHYEFGLRLSFHVPFVFVAGPVAIQNLAGRPAASYWKGQSYGKSIAAIVEKNLAQLPDTREYAEVRRRTRRSVLTRTIHLLGALGDIDRLRADLIAVVQWHPWLLVDSESHEVLRRGICQVAVAVAAGPGGSVATVQEFCAEIKHSVARGGFRERWALRRLLHEACVSVAIALREEPRRDDRAAGRATALALVYDPTQWKRRVVLVLLVRSIFAGPRWDSIFVHLRRLLR